MTPPAAMTIVIAAGGVGEVWIGGMVWNCVRIYGYSGGIGAGVEDVFFLFCYLDKLRSLRIGIRVLEQPVPLVLLYGSRATFIRIVEDLKDERRLVLSLSDSFRASQF